MCIVAAQAFRIVRQMDKWIALVRTKLRELKLTQEKLAERVGASQGVLVIGLTNVVSPTSKR